MSIQQLFRSSRSLLLAASIASLMPLMLGGAAAIAQTAQSTSDVKPLSNQLGKLPQGNMSGKKGAPSRRFGGGSRIQNVCAVGPQAMAMISPADNVTVTTSDQPSLMLWVNESKQERNLEFAILDGNGDDGQDVYRKMLKLSDKAGLVTLDMSELEDAPRLSKGEDYYIYLSLVCDANDRSKDMVVEGQLSSVDFDLWVAQRQPSLSTSSQSMNTLDPFFQVEQSIEVGLWHDAMVQLNRLRQEGSSAAIRQQAQQRWEELLEADEELYVIADDTKTALTPLAIADVPELNSF